MKKCTKCGVEKPLSEFHKDKATKTGVRSICRACYSLFHYEYYRDNTEKVKIKNKKQWLKRKYNMELEQFQKIKDEQNESCAICNAKLKAGFMVHVDHDHKTGEVRGILCRWCNTGLGNFKDSIDNLKSAVKYLKKYCSKSAEK